MVLLVVSLLAACEEPGTGPGDGGTSADPAVPLGQTHPDRNFVDPEYDQDLVGVVNLLNAYWAGDFAQLAGTAYQPMPTERISTYYPGNMPGVPEACAVTPHVGVNNALHCGGYISWDETFLHALYEQIGDFAPSMVVAHEWGHYIQFLLSSRNDYDIRHELQADCYAGAFMRHAQYEAQVLEDGDFQEGVFNFKAIARERPSDPWTAANAHGTPEERAIAVVLGFAAFEPTVCAEYDDWERGQLPLDLGGGLTLTLARNVVAEVVQPGHIQLSFERRGTETYGDLYYLPDLSLENPTAIVEAVLNLGPVTILHTTETRYLDGSAVAYQYEQQLNGGPVHGMLWIATSDQMTGVIAADVLERGSAPVDLRGDSWQRIAGYSLLTLAGLEPAQ